MSGRVMTCAEVRELAPELALGILGGAERAEVVLHVNGCARCQASVTELTEVADVLPQLVAESEPPAGFEAQVLRRLGERERRIRRRWLGLVAAVAAAAIIVSVALVRVIDSNNAPSASSTAAGAPVAVTMHGGERDAPAGWAYVSGRHGVAIAVDYGVPPGSYTVWVDPSRGKSASIGTMQVRNGRGSWTGRSTAPLTGGSRITLVDGAGTQVCQGTVPPAE